MVALARPGPISKATSITDTDCSKARCEPSGRVITGMKFSLSVAAHTRRRMKYIKIKREL